MPTKTDRILSYLPRTFQTSPRPPVLYAVADAFGNELLLGENSLAAVMLAHWVDFADKNAAEITDLEQMAALYGLAPRRDSDGESLESVEEFRDHLKRYIRTFLEGTVTVQGSLRVTAEALAVRIADETEQLERWWTRGRDEVVTIEPGGDDAASLLRFERSRATGSPARPGQVKGSIDLSGVIDLQGASILRLKVDGLNLGEIDLRKGSPASAPITLDQIVQTINQPPRPNIARPDGRYLILASPTTGPDSKLEVLGGPGDAATRLLGLAPRSFHGTPATAAQLIGAIDLSQPVNLSKERFLRVEIDGKRLAEIDCAGPAAAQTDLAHIRDAINQALGINVAADDGKHLILKSPTKGFQSTISVQPPAAQNAARRLFGVATAFQTGQDAQPARATSTRDLRGGIDLSERSNILLRIDAAAPVKIDCAGANPAKTQRVEIVAAINAAVKADVAAITEVGISMASPSVGPTAQIVFETAPGGDASSDIFGIGSLTFEGNAPTKARLSATPVLTKKGGVDVRAQDVLLLAVDGGAPVAINLHRAAGSVDEVESVSLDKLAAAINDAFGGAAIAATEGKRLLLASPIEGGASSLEILPLETTRQRRFVTRAVITDEAAPAIFGFISKSERGTPATTARLIGVPDLSQSVDLRDERFLRLIVDSHPALEIDCAGPRPRATTLEEIVEKINARLKQAGLTKEVAGHDGKHLVMISPSSGSGSRIAFEPPHVALETLLGIAPVGVRGQDATQVRLTGAVDLSAGIDLDPQAAIKLGFDGDAPVEISLGGPTPNHQSPFQIASTINATLKATVASTDGRRIVLSSSKKGPESKIEFAPPSGHDATKDIFGFSPPRAYQGEAALPARVEGARDLVGAVDLSVFRFLSVSIDGGPTRYIDCAAKASKPEAATLAEIVQSIGPETASISDDGKHLVITSPTAGATGQISLEAYTPGDARDRLFGKVEDITAGTPAAPAVITGTAGLLGPVNLSVRSLLRIAVDGGRPVDIDVAGQVPGKTAADEIVAKINRVVPALASVTNDDHLQLTSPIAGEVSSLSLLPLRYLEVIEYPSQSAPPLLLSARHRDDWAVVNDGAADVVAEVLITAPQGTVGPTLVNSSLGWSARLFAVIEAGESVRLRSDARVGLQAEIVSVEGKSRSVPGSRILVGPLGAQAWVPFNGTWRLSGETGDAATLQLNNPLARAIVLLRAKQSGGKITVSVSESDLTRLTSPPAVSDGGDARLVGRMRVDKGKFHLADASGNPIAELLAGPHANLSDYADYVIAAGGPLHAYPPLMIVQTITRLFDVVLQSSPQTGAAVEERYSGVTIGVGTAGESSLVRQINADSKHTSASTLVHAEELDKGAILSVPRGRTSFRYLDCQGSRFDQARFDEAHFPDGVCGERGIFDVSRFTDVPPEQVNTVFASADPLTDPLVKIDFRWVAFNPGSFVVNLPADLPARFGGRFNEARFGQAKDKPELYAGAVAEPPGDPKFLASLITDGTSNVLKAAEAVASVPLGWSPVKIPFRKPQFLTLGRQGQAARLYLAEEGLAGFIKLEAKEEGAWGNEIAVAARQVGPAIYDVSVVYLGGRFENARAAVLGEPAGELTQTLLQAGSIGVLQAKAAGVRVAVTRDRAEYEQLTTTQ